MVSIQGTLVKFWMKRYLRPLIAKSSIEELRESTNRSTRLGRTPKGVVYEPVMANGVPCEWATPTHAQAERYILYIHGGGWVICSPATHRGLVGALASLTHARALSVDYRLAPEHPFPAALDDCLAAYHWLLEQGADPAHIVVAGDSAGGNLTLSLLLALRRTGERQAGERRAGERRAGERLPAAAVCFSPATDLTGEGESFNGNADIDPLLSTQAGHSWLQAYLNGQSPLEPLISPLYGDLHGLPPLLIQVGSDEILLSDSVRFAERACQAGVDVKLDVWPGMWHVFQSFSAIVPEAKRAINKAGEFINGRI